MHIQSTHKFWKCFRTICAQKIQRRRRKWNLFIYNGAYGRKSQSSVSRDCFTEKFNLHIFHRTGFLHCARVFDEFYMDSSCCALVHFSEKLNGENYLFIKEITLFRCCMQITRNSFNVQFGEKPKWQKFYAMIERNNAEFILLFSTRSIRCGLRRHRRHRSTTHSPVLNAGCQMSNAYDVAIW